jgi:prephenate dehydrogenase
MLPGGTMQPSTMSVPPSAEPSTSTSGTATFGTVAIIGLGLIGGSVARDLAARGTRLLGHDRDPDAVRDALRAGVVDAALGDDLAGVEEADVVIVATPVDEGPRVLAALAAARPPAPRNTHRGSTKSGLLGAATALGLGSRFVGSHPLAGDHRWGWRASRRDLFAGARVYLCPAAAAAEAVTLARSLWESLGATPELSDAASHDELLAWSSHLPQVTATVLALTLRQAGVERALLGPGGRDTTRLSGSSPELWTAIAGDNAIPLTAAIELLECRLGELRAALQAGDAPRLLALFSAARDWSGADGVARLTG